jgi:serine/threonine protein phosphatase PrpC
MPHTAKLDPLFEIAKLLILDTKNPTISLVQRRMLIGYNRAVNLIQAMEGEIVTPRDQIGRWKMLVGETYDTKNEPYWAGVDGWIWASDETPVEQAHVSVRCFSKRGVSNARNEDTIMLPGLVQQGTVREYGRLDVSAPRYFAIADGVSSSAEPRIASFRLLSRLSMLTLGAQANTSILELLHRLQMKFVALGDKPEYFGMASTLVGARLVGNEVTIFNVGDSRAYLLTNSSNGCHAKLLRRDHNRTSQFTADPAYDELHVNVVTHTLQQGKRLLLCSDGLNEVLSDTEIAELFTENSGKALIKAYIAYRRAGGTDDFSVIVIEVVNADSH